MSAKEKLEQIRQLLFGAVPPAAAAPAPAPAPAPAAPAEEEFKDYPTADPAVVLSIDKLEVGGKVMIAGAPAADGEYQLADGTSLQVAAGAIVEISSAQEDAIPEEMKSLPGKMSAIEEKFAAFETEHNNLKAEFSTAKETISKQYEAIKGLFEVIEKLTATPTADPAAKPASFRNTEGKQDRLARIANAFQQYNSQNKN